MTTDTHEIPSETQARRLEHVYEQVATLMRQPDVAQRLRAAHSENEWSAMQILAHMVEMIPYWLNHCQVMIVATLELPTLGRTLDSPERLAGVERATIGTPDELLSLLNDEVQAAAIAIRQMSPAARSKKGINPGRGEMTVAEVIEGRAPLVAPIGSESGLLEAVEVQVLNFPQVDLERKRKHEVNAVKQLIETVEVSRVGRILETLRGHGVQGLSSRVRE